jgi:hypothetical protein
MQDEESSMKFVRIIDTNGLFVEDAFADELTELTIETPCPAGFYRPRWDGTAWVEGLTQAEIDAIKSGVTPTEPTLEERVTAVETEQTAIIDTLTETLGVVI